MEEIIAKAIVGIFALPAYVIMHIGEIITNYPAIALLCVAAVAFAKGFFERHN